MPLSLLAILCFSFDLTDVFYAEAALSTELGSVSKRKVTSQYAIYR